MKRIRPNHMRRLRRQLDLSQTDIAKTLNSYQVQVSRWERGKRRVPKVIKERVSEVLSFPVDVIFPDSEDR